MIRFHPILFPIFFTLILTGNISFYVLLLISLLVHEVGHLFAVKLIGGRVVSCTIMPYGGEIIVARSFELPPQKGLIIVLGGPVFTLLLLFVSLFSPEFIKQPMIHIQLVLLAVNLLPLYPLDGGRAIIFLLEMWTKMKHAKKIVYLWSIVMYSLLGIGLSFIEPKASLVAIFFLFLIVQNIHALRYLKYEIALHKQLKNKKMKIS